MKAEEVSGGTIQAWGLRLAVALGVGIGVAMGTLRNAIQIDVEDAVGVSHQIES